MNASKVTEGDDDNDDFDFSNFVADNEVIDENEDNGDIEEQEDDQENEEEGEDTDEEEN